MINLFFVFAFAHDHSCACACLRGCMHTHLFSFSKPFLQAQENFVILQCTPPLSLPLSLPFIRLLHLLLVPVFPFHFPFVYLLYLPLARFHSQIFLTVIFVIQFPPWEDIDFSGGK